MKKYIILKLLFLIGTINLVAQGNILSLTCADAPIVCQLDGFTTYYPTGFNSTDQPSTFCDGIQNNRWISFIAGSETIVFDVSISFCGFLGEGGAMQVQVYAICGAPWTSASNCLYEIMSNSTETITMTNLTIGDRYYMMTDGGGGYPNCTYSINVTEGFSISSNPDIIVDAGEDILFDCFTQEVPLNGSNSIFELTDSIAWLNNSLLHISDSIAFTATQSGTYYLVIQESGGEVCPSIDTVEALSFNDILPSPFLFPFIEIFADTIGQAVFLDAINSNAIDSNYIFSWTTNDGNIVAHPDSLYPLISSSGIYTLEITHTEKGCVTTNEVVVTIVDPVSVFSPIKNTLQVEISPTVTNDKIRINYVLEKTNAVSMQVCNIGGVLLQDVGFGKKQTGEHVETLSLKDFLPGIYFVFVKTEEGSAVRKVVKM